MRQATRDYFFEFTAKFEGVVNWMYLDVYGFVTVGVGNLLDTPTAAAELPFVHNSSSSLADTASKQQGWNDVRRRQDLVSVGHLAFAAVCDLRLSDNDIRDLVDRKLTENEASLVAVFPGFALWPADAQLGLLSMVWALGLSKLLSLFPRFCAACRSLDFDTAASECRIQTARNPGVILRNIANEGLFRNAARVQKPGNPYDPERLYYPVVIFDEIVVEGDPADVER